MATPFDSIEAEPVRAAMAFHGRKLWERHGADTFLALEVPAEPDLIFASLIGQGGEGFGLDTKRGPDAAAQVLVDTMPVPVVPEGMQFRIPRDCLLRDLGLAEEGSGGAAPP